MSTRSWVGGKQAVAQVNTWTFAGTWEADDIVQVVIGTRVVNITTGSTTIATITDTVAAALNALTQAEFAEITWADTATTVTATGDTAGVPFTVTFQPLESDGTTPDAAATIEGVNTADPGTATTACTGPNHADDSDNWSGSTLPVDADTIIFADTAVDCLYGLDGLSGVTAAVLEVRQTFTGNIGLPAYNTSGYAEYRDRYLQFEAATVLTVGKGEGQGSNRVNIDTGSAGASAVLVLNTGTPLSVEQAAFNWKATHASSTLTVQKGTVGVALFPGETATIATLNIGYQTNPAGDAKVYLGEGVTLTTINQSGGVLHTRSNLATMNQTDGEWKHFAGTVTTINGDGGACRYRSTGTCTTVNVGSDYTMDFQQDASARTFTNVNLYEGYKWLDPAGTVTATNGYDNIRTSPGNPKNKFITAENRTWTPTSI